MMIDTHAHVFTDEFTHDFADAIERAFNAGVTDIVMPAITLDSFQAMQRLQPGRVRLHATTGLHPCDVTAETNLKTLEEALFKEGSLPEIVAFGETGLDYYWSREHISSQKEALKLHFEAAKYFRKPVILHNRDSTQDLLSAVEEAQNGALTGVWHCFTGTADEGRRAIELGLNLGVGGVITFKNGKIDAFINELGIEHVVLETDSPYLAPVPFRGKRNEPAYLKNVCERLSTVCDLSFAETAHQTTSNANRLFGLNPQT